MELTPSVDSKFPTIVITGDRLRSTPAHPSLRGPRIMSANQPIAVDCDGCTLDGQPLQTVSQWEVALKANRLRDIEGAFVVAWHEGDSLLLARDAIGERTLFYAPLPDQKVIIGSSIQTILNDPRVPRQLSGVAIATYLTYAYIPGRMTMIAGVFEVQPGEIVRIRPHGVIEYQTFWEMPTEPESYADDASLADGLRVTLNEAIAKRIPVGEPFGVSLSGGLDSSLVLGISNRLQPQTAQSFSISFGTQYANELPFSSLMASHCGSNHRIIEMSPDAVARAIEPTMAALSDPIGDPLTVPNALLFRAASEHVRVMLNGEGGDPCFGGPKNLPMVLSDLYGNNDLTARIANYLRAHLKCYDELARMLTPRVQSCVPTGTLDGNLIPSFADNRYRTFVTRLQAMNIRLKGGHHILPKVDALSALSGVLARSPLFDRKVVEFSFRIPPQGKLRGSIEKWLLKQAVLDVVPEAIIQRPKSGMLVPVEGWFHGPLLPQAKEWLLDGLTRRDLIRRDYLDRLIAGKLGGTRPRHGAKIWLLVSLEAWLKTHVGPQPIPVV